MNRRDFQELARIRLREARQLVRSRRFDGACYLAGYAVECALKACVAKKFGRHEWPDKAFVNQIYIHSLPKLVGLADLSSDLERRMNADLRFATNWAVVKDWNEESRYAQWDEKQARDLYSAVTSRSYGVLPWIRRHW